MTGLSLPREHGALITLGGAITLAIVLAPAPLDALAAALACAAGFFARGPLERHVAGGRLLARDPLLLGACAALAAAAIARIAVLDPAMAAAAAVVALAFPTAGAVARLRRAHRSLPVETAGMIACGAVAGLVLWIGGAAPERAGLLAAVLALYGAATVLAVRGEARKLPAASSRRNALLGLAVAGAGAIALLFALPLAAAGLLPRMVTAAARAARPLARPHIHAIAIRETVALAAFLLLLGLASRI